MYQRLILLLTVSMLLFGSYAFAQTQDFPEDWRAAWNDPPAECRPLQIIHGITPQLATKEALKKFKDLGLGGIVCNINFDKYLIHEPYWRDLVEAMKACQELGMVVWIYDEHGYPSAAAGGLVLKDNPELEALALAYDPSQASPFIVRPSYEHTHASNNFHAARRYPNLIDQRATAKFIETTHDAYLRRLQPFFGDTIVAVFTDEPSLMAVNIGPLPDEVRKSVRVQDSLDNSIKSFPSIPWVKDLPQLYKERYGQDLIPLRKSLFAGTTQADCTVRRNFWSLVSDLLAERYYGRLQNWSRSHKVASSGHILWEEMPLHGVALEGNPLQMLYRMDIPGLDMLNSDPQAVIYSGWLTAALPTSAAIFNGGRKVMSEMSDFSQQMAKQGHVTLDKMCAAAAWQIALGVTEFNLYYTYSARTPEDYRAYCEYVGRCNTILRDARQTPDVLLYYPIYDLWAEYIPVAEKLTLQTQSARAQQISNSFLSIGSQLTRRQVSFALTDHKLLQEAVVRGSKLQIKGASFDSLVLPARVELPPAAVKVVEGFEAAGGKVLRADAGGAINTDPLVAAQGTLSVPNDRIIVGRFNRDGRDILIVVNVGSQRYEGAISVKNASNWIIADPGTGKIELAKTDESSRIPLSLAGSASRILISPGGSDSR